MSALPVAPAVCWSEDGHAVRMLDQTLLPDEERWLRLETPEDVAEAIVALRVRGAPAVGIAGALGLALGAVASEGTGDVDAARSRFEGYRELLANTRPTGRNLVWALDRVAGAFHAALDGGLAAASAAARREADRVVADETLMCERIGEAGVSLLPPTGATVMTHCNAGALATAGLGTALAPIYVALRRGIPVRVAACETRPVLQGARLTAWELGRAGVDTTVITDSMAAAMMRDGEVGLVIVGADRVAANGDVANKIGTYGLAVLARHHGIPFYVAAPTSTFDASLATGAEIEIETRHEDEVRTGLGRRILPDDAHVWNPAFDVTPAHLVTALLTDGGVLRPPYGPRILELVGLERSTAEDS